jgi:hypothetical protein
LLPVTKEPAMSMIRDLRAAVRPSRPSLRKDTGA